METWEVAVGWTAWNVGHAAARQRAGETAEAVERIKAKKTEDDEEVPLTTAGRQTSL